MLALGGTLTVPPALASTKPLLFKPLTLPPISKVEVLEKSPPQPDSATAATNTGAKACESLAADLPTERRDAQAVISCFSSIMLAVRVKVGEKIERLLGVDTYGFTSRIQTAAGKSGVYGAPRTRDLRRELTTPLAIRLRNCCGWVYRTDGRPLPGAEIVILS